jgi:hypothetical protein
VNTSALLAVQAAIYDVLTSDATLAAMAAVYDWVPEPASYPYVTLGEDIETPDNVLGDFGSRVSTTLHVWSRYRGFAEMKPIIARIMELLDHQDFTVEGRTLIVCRHEQTLTLRDPDPDVRHGTIRFSIETYAS